MKTKLPESIKSVDEAKKLLTELTNNGESFHPEDDATDLQDDPFNIEEGEKLNKLMEDIYNLPGNDGRHVEPMVFDPCQFLLDIDPFHFPDLDDVSKEDAAKLLEIYSREKIINWIKSHDSDAAVTDEAQIAEYGKPATKEELINIFWSEYEEANS